MMDNLAISVNNVSLRYRIIKRQSIKKTLLHFKRSEIEYYEALKGVTFQLEKGKVLGLIGKNGSGKSTLLRTIAGIFSPDEGSVDLHGNSVAMLSIGIGFQRKLSGRENIMLSGLLMGFTEETVRESMDKIIDFSELEDFIDRPVRTYSSGMYSKLAFSIAAFLNTDILLIDEVLSVGDARFRNKSLKKIRELISERDRTVIIVSHSLETVQDLCDQALWLHDGKEREIGSVEEVISDYQEFMK